MLTPPSDLSATKTPPLSFGVFLRRERGDLDPPGPQLARLALYPVPSVDPCGALRCARLLLLDPRPRPIWPYLGAARSRPPSVRRGAACRRKIRRHGDTSIHVRPAQLDAVQVTAVRPDSPVVVDADVPEVVGRRSLPLGLPAGLLSCDRLEVCDLLVAATHRSWDGASLRRLASRRRPCQTSTDLPVADARGQGSRPSAQSDRQ